MKYINFKYIFLSILFFIASHATAQKISDFELYDQPVLVIDPGMHTSAILAAASDGIHPFAVTSSSDKTLRVWRIGNAPTLYSTIRIPSGPGDVGEIYSLSISPTSNWIAASGITTGPNKKEQIYLLTFDGRILKRIVDLPTSVTNLAFSPNGKFLVAGLGHKHGIRVYDTENSWAELTRDKDYGGSVTGVDFTGDAHNFRLTTTSVDGYIRIYNANFVRTVKHLLNPDQIPIAFKWHPDGKKFSVINRRIKKSGLKNGDISPHSNNVEIYDSVSFDRLALPDPTHPIYQLGTISWSEKGDNLYAGGRARGGPHIVWEKDGLAPHIIRNSGATNAIRSLTRLVGDELLVPSADPHLAILNKSGKVRWHRSSPNFDPRRQKSNLSVSADGKIVDFGFKYGGGVRARFDLNKLALTLNPPDDGVTTKPLQNGMPISDWVNRRPVHLRDKKLEINRNELSRSFAIHPEQDKFSLGSDWHLRLFDNKGN